MEIKIAIADDHPLVISGLQHILKNHRDMTIVGTYSNGSELLQGLKEQIPDVLLLDIFMPGQSGDQLALYISKHYPTIRMLVLTNLDNVFYIKTMMRHGVLGYLLKTTREENLLEAIQAVYEGNQYLEPYLKEKILKDTLQTKRQMTVEPLLTRREKEILQLIASNYTSQEIADKLFLSKKTIDNHRTSLLMKLDVKNSASLIKKAIQLGLIE